MERLKAIGSTFIWGSQSADSQESVYSKFTKIAAGIGIAGLAFLSWKIVAAGALAYSAYKGGRYFHSRYFQGRTVKKEGYTEASAIDEEEHTPPAPVAAGHEAHGNTQQGKTDAEKEAEIIAGLRRQQAEYSSRAIKNTFEILITHRDIGQKGNNIQWVGKMLRKHGPWVKWTFGLSLPVVKAYRKIKSCWPAKKKPDVVE